MSGLIPIKLAEQAMANLEAELTDLRSTADRFKADVEHLTSENLLVREEADRYCRLWQKAQVEVESLMTNPTSRLLRAEREENARLKAEVERLTKYGDVLESGLRTLPGDFPRCLANEWKAAKEGKQS